MKTNLQLQIEVAWACRLLAKDGHSDFSLGHVSARATQGDAMLIKRRGVSLEEVKPSDVLHVDLDGKKLEGEGNIHLEYPFHSEVYKHRKDVGAVMHTHPPYATAMSATTQRLKMVTHDSTLFYDGVARFNDSPNLVTNQEQGHTIALALGAARALLLRNHGVLVVGKDIPWVVITALTLERAIKFQMLADALGGSDNEMSEQEAKQLHQQKFQDVFIYDYWDYLVRNAKCEGDDVR